eukprot:4619792-Pyramimonas_sp.AAC.1
MLNCSFQINGERVQSPGSGEKQEGPEEDGRRDQPEDAKLEDDEDPDGRGQGSRRRAHKANRAPLCNHAVSSYLFGSAATPMHSVETPNAAWRLRS